MVYVFMAYITFYCFMFLGYVVCEFFQIIGNVKNFPNICIIDKNSFISGPIQLNPCCSRWASLSASHTHVYIYSCIHMYTVHTCTVVYVCVCTCVMQTEKQPQTLQKRKQKKNHFPEFFQNKLQISWVLTLHDADQECWSLKETPGWQSN